MNQPTFSSKINGLLTEKRKNQLKKEMSLHASRKNLLYFQREFLGKDGKSLDENDVQNTKLLLPYK